MMTIKTMWFYAALAMATCGGAGLGYVALPSQGDIDRAIRQTQLEMARDCSTGRGKPLAKGEFRNSRKQGF